MFLPFQKSSSILYFIVSGNLGAQDSAAWFHFLWLHRRVDNTIWRNYGDRWAIEHPICLILSLNPIEYGNKVVGSLSWVVQDLGPKIELLGSILLNYGQLYGRTILWGQLGCSPPNLFDSLIQSYSILCFIVVGILWCAVSDLLPKIDLRTTGPFFTWFCCINSTKTQDLLQHWYYCLPNTYY
jgi:hypothetical protein